ncbi:dentin sialophosphoprotein-like [Teleopsis dalmanni]|uniref:dentin sialophosphoprotein-like n=1 Tax=Teleopsis dalmanni TaxID=139649 RepID=UPI0018CDE6E8|nr:dentin sialophosphoprotein-like [Teleopsis dalmanni]XP_037960615.1 dentin sialophosphoprotein-like [Teleopsis dalmanni]
MASNRNRRDRSRRNRPEARSAVNDSLGSDGEYDDDDDDMCDSPIDWFAETEFDERLLDPQFFVKFITNTDEKPKEHNKNHQFRHSIVPRELLGSGTSSSTTVYSTPSTDNTDSTDNTASSSAGNTNTAIHISSYESENSRNSLENIDTASSSAGNINTVVNISTSESESAQNSSENTDASGSQCSTIFSSPHNTTDNTTSNINNITTSHFETSHGTNNRDSSTNDEMIALDSLISTMGLLGVTPTSGTMLSNSGDINSSLDALSGLFNGLNTSDSMTSNDNNQSESSDSDIEN